MSKARQKGTAWESACVEYLRDAFDDQERTIHRSALNGADDEGDIHGLSHNGGRIVIECKNCKRYEFREWVRQADDEAWNAGAEYGVVFAKLNGIGIAHVGNHLAVMDIDTFIRLIGGEIPE